MSEFALANGSMSSKQSREGEVRKAFTAAARGDCMIANARYTLPPTTQKVHYLKSTMADYNLHGLNPRDFQHLVQGLARKRIAAGVTAFGDGKDGARDLTYRGKMDYPSQTAPWDGYLVLGCKFQQKPTGTTKSEQQWALKHLESDLKKYLNKKRKLPKPEFYLFVTNAALTGVADKGGRDILVSKLNEYASKLNLKGHSIWDYNDLRGLLDGDDELRAAYGHFVTAGDVLAEMRNRLRLQHPNFTDVMHAFLQKELIADMSAKLQSAGEDQDVRIPLANVFVDLPFAESAEAAVLVTDHDEDKLSTVVRALLEAGAGVLRRTAHDDGESTREARRLGQKRSRFVIVGGPGQGKSTFGQYLCQLYRAAIIKDRPPERLDDEVPKILKQLGTKPESAARLPLTRRFPVRIELRNFSHALAAEPTLSLLEYIRRDIARLGSATIAVEDLKSWLAQYPWVLVLDGLDEVPPSSNRSEVMREIECLRVDCSSCNADLLVVATTRPQSYSREFSEDLFQHFFLTPLSPRQALHYGRKLAEARCGADERRRDELIQSLEKACHNHATSRLMQSPLQVTIMATLLEDTGEPPQQRYRLFAEYYRTIYKRETRRKLLGGILTERQKDIDTIHAQAGLLLQASGESTITRQRHTQTQELDSALSDEQFKELVRRRLEQIGVQSARMSELLAPISAGTLQRLVFLVRPRLGWVQFDITSFKEFMAAEAIMNGSDEDIRERMKVIAPISYWRNVFQFAVGKCFIEREHLLDNLVSLCTGLNEDKACGEILADGTAGRAAKVVLWGSRLALDVLADGTSRQYPGYEEQFASIALRLVRTADQECCARLAAIFHEDLKSLYVEAIQDRLGQANIWSQLGAWHLLTGLADRDVAWAVQMLAEGWPTSVEAQREILLRRGRRSPSKWISRKILELAPDLEPIWLLRSFDEDLFTLSDVANSRPWNHLLMYLQGGFRNCEVVNHSVWSEVVTRLHFTPCHLGNHDLDSIAGLSLRNPEWAPVLAAARFGSSPSARSLASELRRLSETWEPNTNAWLSPLPWPLALCIRHAKTRDDLVQLAIAAEAGRLGETADWTAGEQRWCNHGLKDADFLCAEHGELPISPSISSVGFPFGLAGYSPDEGFATTQLADALDRLRHVPDTVTRSWLASVMLNVWEYPRGRKGCPTPPQFRELYSQSAPLLKSVRRDYWVHKMFLSAPAGALSEEWVEFFDWAGREGMTLSADNSRPELAEQLVHQFCSNPSGRRGLLHILAEFCMTGGRCVLPDYVLTAARTWDARANTDAIGLSLAREKLTEGQFLAEARDILKGDKVGPAVWRSLRLASSISLKQSAEFALAVLAQIEVSSTDEREAESHCRRVLTEFLMNRPSLLQDPNIWKRLKFPERL